MMVTWVSIVRSLAPVFHLHRSGRGFEPVFVPSSRVLSVYSYSPSIGTGSNVTRLQKSIELFHAHRASTSQKIDDTYCAFVWGRPRPAAQRPSRGRARGREHGSIHCPAEQCEEESKGQRRGDCRGSPSGASGHPGCRNTDLGRTQERLWREPQDFSRP